MSEYAMTLPSQPAGLRIGSKLIPSSTHVVIINHGLKTGGLTVPRAHCYLDARGLPDGAQNFLARDINWMKAAVDLRPYLAIFEDGYGALPTRRDASRLREPFIVCTLCAYGRNRSVMLKQLLGEELRRRGYSVEVR